MGTGEQTNEDSQCPDCHRGKRRDIGAQLTGLDLWSFATALYGYGGVAEACLRAQDELDADVNLLLFALWAATRGQGLTSAAVNAVEAQVADWREQVIKPLRRQRQVFKNTGVRRGVYEAIKALELDAERYQLTWMEEWLDAQRDTFKLTQHRPIGENPDESGTVSRAGEDTVSPAMALAQQNLRVALLDGDRSTADDEAGSLYRTLSQEVMATLLKALSADSDTA